MHGDSLIWPDYFFLVVTEKDHNKININGKKQCGHAGPAWGWYRWLYYIKMWVNCNGWITYIPAYVMGTRDLPNMYAQGPQTQGMRAFISGKPQIHMLQVLCNTWIAKVTILVGWMRQVIVTLVCVVIAKYIVKELFTYCIQVTLTWWITVTLRYGLE